MSAQLGPGLVVHASPNGLVRGLVPTQSYRRGSANIPINVQTAKLVTMRYRRVPQPMAGRKGLPLVSSNVRSWVVVVGNVHLCGHRFAPVRDPQRFPVCPRCKELARVLGFGGGTVASGDQPPRPPPLRSGTPRIALMIGRFEKFSEASTWEEAPLGDSSATTFVQMQQCPTTSNGEPKATDPAPPIA